MNKNLHPKEIKRRLFKELKRREDFIGRPNAKSWSKFKTDKQLRKLTRAKGVEIDEID